MNIRVIPLIGGLLWLLTPSFAQQSTNAAGNDASGSGGHVSYSVGEVVFTTSTGSGGTSEAGIQHAYDMAVIVGNENTNFDLHISTYPNPVMDELIISTDLSVGSSSKAILTNVAGEQLATVALDQAEKTIYTTELPAGTYFLSVIQNQQAVKTFKIIKH